MLGFFADLKKYMKKNTLKNDLWFFRLFYRTFFIVLLCIGGGLSIRNITGEPIVCLSHGVPGKKKDDNVKYLKN